MVSDAQRNLGIPALQHSSKRYCSLLPGAKIRQKTLLAWIVLQAGIACATATQVTTPPLSMQLEWIHLEPDGRHFVSEESKTPFLAWGLNYDHDTSGRLLEDYWISEWPTVEEDFHEMKALGANVVRIHLQLGRFMKSPKEPDAVSLNQLARLLRLAENTGLYLDITGLGCYHKKDVPAWYDLLEEAERWNVQAEFWSAVARVGASSPAVFCYDLMNEPILPGAGKKETEWLAGEFGGKFFVQRLALDLDGRSPKQVARSWVDQMVAAIRAYDRRHLITVGVIPWALVFPGAKPLFYSEEVGAGLDFVSVHFYPKQGEVAKALAALAVYDIGKPLVVEEMFPLECTLEELDAFIEGSRKTANGWIGFYWGKTIDAYSSGTLDLGGAITLRWLEYFRAKTPQIFNPGHDSKSALFPPNAR
jgi:hypothetical protein